MDAVEDTEEEEDIPVVQEVPPPLEDVSKVSFTIRKICTFGGVAIVDDSDFVVLDDFDFRYFNQ
jgi:hypothetical protein